MSLRTVADETSTPGVPVMWAEPTGSAVSMYSETTAFKMAALRGSSSSSGADAGGHLPFGRAGAGGTGGWARRCALFAGGPWAVLALDSTECYLGATGQGLEDPVTGPGRPPPPAPRPGGAEGVGGPGRLAGPGRPPSPGGGRPGRRGRTIRPRRR